MKFNCKECKFNFKSKKSLSNHTRFGCRYKGFNSKEEAIKNMKLSFFKSERGKYSIKMNNKKQRAKFPEKILATRILNHAIRDGKIEKKPCIKCGDEKVQGHHKDYSKPLEVIWLCMKHHRMEHNRWKGGLQSYAV